MNKTKLNFAGIITVLADNQIEIDSFINREANVVKLLGSLETKRSPNFEDYEEQGREDEDYYVTYLVDHDIYIKTVARVDSYSSNETYPYGYGKEVKPVVKPTTVYE